jgi:two-component system, NarL family, response regulator YdfI
VRRVLVVAQSAVVRAGLESLVALTPDLELVGTAPSINHYDYARLVGETDADVALVALGADANSFDGLLALLEAAPSVAVVALDDAGASSRWPEALRAGARAILAREATAEEIRAAVAAAAAGLFALEAGTVESLLNGGAEPRRVLRPEEQVEALTPREVEVLGLLAEGSGNKQIAFRLGISEHTVKFHVASIFSKLGASSRTEAVALGVRRGLVML